MHSKFLLSWRGAVSMCMDRHDLPRARRFATIYRAPSPRSRALYIHFHGGKEPA
jgi:hypothetical protein